MLNFAFVGVGGYIAPRHLQAINDVGGKVVLACDEHDSVGAMDRFSLKTPFVKSWSAFKEKFKEIQKTTPIHYITICTPNYLHKEQIEFGLKNGCDVICEKPLVLTTQDVEDLLRWEKETNHKVYTILQLREHDAIKALKKTIDPKPAQKYELDLQYITSRGPWYHVSWKGDEKKSGGLATNIGIHLFDMLVFLFGDLEKISVDKKNEVMCQGKMELNRAKINFLLSIDESFLPASVASAKKTTFRSIKMNGKEIEFSEGFTELHTICYKNIMSGHGHGPGSAKVAIEIVEKIRRL